MLEVRCPICQTSFVVGDKDAPVVDPRTVDGIHYLMPQKIGNQSTWDMAREKAKENCEESWEDLDRETREDKVHAEYNKLIGEMTMKGMTKKDERMEALKAMGFDVDAMLNAGLDLSKFMKNEDKNIVEQIYANGYVKNQKLHRRFIAAQYMRLLTWVEETKSYDNWTYNLNKTHGYQYQFDFLLKELHVLAKLEKSDKECFEERVQFFNKDVVLALCEDYIKKLDKYIRSWKTKNCKGVPYITYKGTDVFVDDIWKKIMAPIYTMYNSISSANSYEVLEIRFRNFCKSRMFTKLNWNTPKCDKWVDAYKGAGAYYTALNFIRFSKLRVDGMNAKDSEEVLKAKTKAYKKEYWRLHAFVKELLRDNNFKFAEVING